MMRSPLIDKERPKASQKPRAAQVAAAAAILFALATVSAAVLSTNQANAAGPGEATSGPALSVQDSGINYRPMVNPGRGFYHMIETWTPDYQPLNSTELAILREDGYTLVLRSIYLNAFAGNVTLSSPISDQVLAHIRNDFNTLREAGVKAVLRFSYAKPEIEHSRLGEYGDSDLATCKMHIDQLSPLLKENADVIAIMQLGLIGYWGEGAYTDYFGMPPTPADWELRHQLISHLLQATDRHRTKIHVRTPMYKTLTMGSEAVTEAQCDQGADNCRVGFHNDCFLASDSDLGTWADKATEYPLVAQQSQYIPSGGETCLLDRPRSLCDTAQEELAMFHYSYLNREYQKEVIDDWTSGGCFNDISARLGYYLRLSNLQIQPTWNSDTAMEVRSSFVNAGYSSPLATYKLHIVFREQSTSDQLRRTYTADLSSLPSMQSRTWLPGVKLEVDTSLSPDQSMASGTYAVYLWVVDASESLRYRPLFNVQMDTSILPNADWDTKLGMNQVGTVEYDRVSAVRGSLGEGAVTLQYDEALSKDLVKREEQFRLAQVRGQSPYGG